MGQSLHKDPRVDIFYELSKPFIYAGQPLEGTIYLNVKADTSYGGLYLKLQGREFCQWVEEIGMIKKVQNGILQTYENELVLEKFEQGLRLGQYAFPFSMRTSPDFSGSFNQENERMGRITYNLKAYLADYTGAQKPQQYSYNVTIIQPPRIAQDIVAKAQANPSVCCTDKGITRLEVSHKYANRGGEIAVVNIKVDNRECQVPTSQATVLMKKHIFVQVNGGEFRDQEEEVELSEMVTPETPAGKQETYRIEIPIPNVSYSTAIGRQVAHYYEIETQALIGACTCELNPVTKTHIYIEARNVAVEPKPKITPPPYWNPMVAPKRIYDVEPVYCFAQNPNIKAMNRAVFEQPPTL